MQIGLGLWLGTRQVGGFSPATLFAAGEQGGWYDPSDLSTMFQDTAGTVPVTATGQTVGLLLDKSGRGNHLTQATAASRPIYGIEPFGGRRNLLTRTEEFDNAAWSNSIGGTGTNPTISANAGVAPDETSTADRLQFSLGGGTTLTDLSRRIQNYSTLASTIYTFSVYLRSFDGSSTYNMHLVGADGVTTGIVVTGAWQRFTVTSSRAGAAVVGYAIGLRGGLSPVSSNTADVLAWGAQLETGSTATAYQRVTDQWNVTQAGVPSVAYIAFDGTDDFMLTGTITPGTDKAQVFAGVRKLSDAASGVLVESSINYGVNSGSFIALAPDTTLSGYRFGSSGSILVLNANTTGFAAPITSVLTGLGDISGDRATLRVNGTQVAQNTADQGTGNYLAYPLYIGRRAGTSLSFNGRIYQMLVRFGANLTSNDLAAAEVFTNQKTGAY